MDAQHWDERYRSQDQLFSGNPNGVLVTEAAGLPPGRALDVGCGEGGDALWLAEQGWQVTAVDISQQLLGDDWTVEVNESRLRTTAPPEGTHHVHDTVLRARRLRQKSVSRT